MSPEFHRISREFQAPTVKGVPKPPRKSRKTIDAISFQVVYSLHRKSKFLSLQIARNPHFGIGLGWQALWVPPLHSILVALVGWLPGVPDLLMASAIFGAVMGILLSVAVWLLAAAYFGRSVALEASVTAALFPYFLWISKVPEAECTYAALLVCSLCFFLRDPAQTTAGDVHSRRNLPTCRVWKACW